MKKLLLSLIAISVYFSTSAQDYIPLLQPGNFWQVGNYAGTAECDLVSAHRLNLSSDTSINGIVYKRFTRQNIYPVNDGPFCWPFATSPEVFETDIFLREDVIEKKVYQLLGEEEILLYDFSLEIGDMVDVMFFGEVDSESVVSDVYYQEYFGMERRVIEIAGPPFIFIEGVGSLNGIVTPFHQFIGSGSELMCFDNYINPVPDQFCVPIATSTKDIENVVAFELFPNPSSSIVYITFDSPTRAELRVLNLNGQEVFAQPLDSEKTQLDLSDLPKGLYVVSILSEEGVGVKKLVVE